MLQSDFDSSGHITEDSGILEVIHLSDLFSANNVLKGLVLDKAICADHLINAATLLY